MDASKMKATIKEHKYVCGGVYVYMCVHKHIQEAGCKSKYHVKIVTVIPFGTI